MATSDARGLTPAEKGGAPAESGGRSPGRTAAPWKFAKVGTGQSWSNSAER